MTALRALSAALVATCWTANAGADLIEADWLVAGDGLITQDTESGLEWLDLTQTLDRSYNDVLSELGSDGEFDGFRHASKGEWEALLSHAGLPCCGAYPFKDRFDLARALQDLIGVTRFVAQAGTDYWYSSGYLTGPQFAGLIAKHDHFPDQDLDLEYSFNSSVALSFSDPDAHYETAAHWLVRAIGSGQSPGPFPVSEPATFILLCAGLMGIVASRLRRACG